MKELVTIDGMQVQRIEYREKPVVTLRMVDRLHQRPTGTAKRVFGVHRDHLTEGQDYYVVPFQEWSKLQQDAIRPSEKSKSHNHMIFLTQYGYLMLVKVFRDHRAWKVQRELVNTYFAPREDRAVAVEDRFHEGLGMGIQLGRMLERHGMDPADLARFCYYRHIGLTQKETARLFETTRDKVQAVERTLLELGVEIPPSVPSPERKIRMMQLLDRLLGVRAEVPQLRIAAASEVSHD